jgi:hypothetical protein
MKLHDKMSNKLGDKLADQIDEIFKSSSESFANKVTGYCVIYSPLACVFIETEDEDALEAVFT